MTRRWVSRLAIVVAAVALTAAAFMFVFRPWYFNWGATAEEISLPLPGDDLVPQPAKAYTRAITIRASAEDVWPWLAQFGQGEGGMYSYEWIEQMIGCDMHNANQVVAEWQTVSPGSEVRMCQEGYGPPPYLVAAAEPGRALIMGHHVEEGSEAWAESWAFVVSPVDAHTTRLLIRSRSMLADGFWAVIEPGVFVMEYGMMHGIKARAEALAGVAPETPWGWIALGAVAALIAGYALIVRPWHLRWGATRDEVSGARPGDDYLPSPKMKATHAIAIQAAPSEVWPWLVQMGQGRAGMYSYEFIENRMMGLDMHNSDRIIPEFQDLKVGDIMPLAANNFGPPVAILEPLRALVLYGDTRNDKSITPMRPGDFWATVWGFYLDEQNDGSTRLVERWSIEFKPGILNFLTYRVFMELGAFIMERRMLLGIKARAEKLAREKSGQRLARV